MDLVDWVKMAWIVMNNDLSITKTIKIYNKHKPQIKYLKEK